MYRNRTVFLIIEWLCRICEKAFAQLFFLPISKISWKSLEVVKSCSFVARQKFFILIKIKTNSQIPIQLIYFQIS